MKTYRVVRYYFKGGKRVIDRGLPLEEVQTYCRNPETSSRTCRSAAGKARTRHAGAWFDGYEEE